MPYDTSVIRELLKAAFNDQDFMVFCYDHFRPVYDLFGKGMAFFWKIQVLIEYCEKNGEFDRLLNLVKQKSPRQYNRFHHALKPSPQTSTSGGSASQMTGPNQTARIDDTWLRIKLRGDLSHLRPEQQTLAARAAAGAIAGALDIPTENITLVQSWTGSMTILVLLSQKIAHLLIMLNTRNDPAIKDLGIEDIRITDVFLKEGNDIVEALQIAYEAEDKPEVPGVIMRLLQKADRFRRDEDLEKALGCCEDAHRLVVDKDWKDYPNISVNIDYAKGQVYAYLGVVHLAHGEEELPAAHRLWAESARLFQRSNRRYSQAVVLMAQGRIETIEEKWLPAMKYYELSLQALGTSRSHVRDLDRLRQQILQHYQEAQQEYCPPSQPVGTISPLATFGPRMENDDGTFQNLWLQLLRLTDALLILDPKSKSTLDSLKKEIVSAQDLIEKGSWHQNWQPLLNSLQQLYLYKQSASAQKTMRELRDVVAKLIRRFLEVLPAHRDLQRVKRELKDLAERLE